MTTHLESEFVFTPDQRVLVIVLRGKLDPLAVQELTPKVEEAHGAGARRFVIDMAELDYLGSVGLGLFVRLHSLLKGEGAVVFCNASAPVRSVLEITKMNRLIRSYPTRAEAIDAVST